MEKYKHLVQYYETDKMGVTHHSNYIRWMEEARVCFLKNIGWDFSKLESLGIISPVVNVECQYKLSTYFEDEILIDVAVEEIKGVKLILKYEMTNEAGKVVATAKSVHCFMDENGRPIRIERQYPDFYKAIIDNSSL